MSAPPLRRSSRLQENKKEAPALTTPKPISSGSFSKCSGCTDSRQRRPRTPLINRRGDYPSSIFNGLLCHWGNGNHCMCHVLPCRLTLLLDPLPQHPPEQGQLLDLLRSLSGRLPDPLQETRVVPGRAEPARKPGPSKPLPSSCPDTARWTRTPFGWTTYAPDDQFPRLPCPEFPPILYHGGHFNHPFSQCGVPGCGRDSIQYRSRPRLDYNRREDSGCFTKLDSSPRSRGASPACRLVRDTAPAEPAVRYRAQRTQSCQTSHPPSPRSRRNSVSAVAVESGVNAFEEVLVDVKVPRTGVYADSA